MNYKTTARPEEEREKHGFAVKKSDSSLLLRFFPHEGNHWAIRMERRKHVPSNQTGTAASQWNWRNVAARTWNPRDTQEEKMRHT